jgi:hypothetical protein
MKRHNQKLWLVVNNTVISLEFTHVFQLFCAMVESAEQAWKEPRIVKRAVMVCTPAIGG